MSQTHEIPGKRRWGTDLRWLSQSVKNMRVIICLLNYCNFAESLEHKLKMQLILEASQKQRI